jgi:transcriptional regulator with XRE-family HTH domain
MCGVCSRRSAVGSVVSFRSTEVPALADDSLTQKEAKALGTRQRNRGKDYDSFLLSANIRNMKTTNLGQELRRLRKEAGLTLRGLAATLEVSAAHLSDIEHNHRRPSDDLLRKIARALRKVGATYESLDHLATGMDPDIREWAASTPGVRKLLRTVKESGQDPLVVLLTLQKVIARKRAGKKRQARAK